MPEASFDDLPSFDARKFEPPSWAKDSFHQWGAKNGESSKSTANGKSKKHDHTTTKEEFNASLEKEGDFENEDDDDDEETWEDAKEDLVEPEEAAFSNAELRDLLDKASRLKEEGNDLFKNKPPKYDEAIVSYLKAIDHIPPTPELDALESEKEKERIQMKNKEREAEKIRNLSGSGGVIQEVTEEEALRIEQEANEPPPTEGEEEDNQKSERLEVQLEIREMTKAVWGNLAACYIAIKDDKKAVEACTEALKIDPRYVKGLHRRATSNERIGELTGLVSAKDDYTLLQTLLPPSSPLLPPIRRSLNSLPERIKLKEKEQMDEMMGKLKDLGNSLLGNFGLSTDNFKFEKQDNGGWGMQFQR
ncbi:uncharacterized protein I303_100635 [Kwoniella dejecticola CBS 10117]|uniref:Uncharacterized protein n=1 Tax=Kwoniella dejecticola CBS 10117 TaxID=1296121 RepID=A0A1A6AFI7_9TREE|nr:uncharacterized protein I303_00638 [Kwoniella dejecticola CBS 10117]OBR88821.1 hypothetical protein I303_00638 [Kwoniella dejecticola CBS 10117]